MHSEMHSAGLEPATRSLEGYCSVPSELRMPLLGLLFGEIGGHRPGGEQSESSFYFSL